MFIRRVGRRYVDKKRGPEGEYLNLVSWFNYTTFDIIGDLAFGDSESFNCLKNGTYRIYPCLESGFIERKNMTYIHSRDLLT